MKDSKTFFSLLKKYEIEEVIDVRDKDNENGHIFSSFLIEKEMKSRGIKYVFAGKQLGQKAYKSRVWKNALKRLVELNEQAKKICLLGGKPYRECHRHTEIAKTLIGMGVPVKHIALYSVIDVTESFFHEDKQIKLI